MINIDLRGGNFIRTQVMFQVVDKLSDVGAVADRGVLRIAPLVD